MSKRLAEKSWQSRREALLEALGTGFETRRQPKFLGKDNATYDPTHPIRLRVSKALDALRRGRLQEVLRILLMGKTTRDDHESNLQRAHRLKSEGHFEQAVKCFASAARQAEDESQCCEAIFQLGHVAKICGRYALAVECFAYASQWSSEGAQVVQASKADLGGAIQGLTSSFRVE